MSGFKRESRYVVMKLTDLEAVSKSGRLHPDDIRSLQRICHVIEAYREAAGKLPLECVVVESDWPEYEAVWKMIEDRMGVEEFIAMREAQIAEDEKYGLGSGGDA